MTTSPKTTPRLRASCDGCYTAKIKCTKERPTCPRCKSLGLLCHYSPSQRAGGRPRDISSRHSASLSSGTKTRTPNTPSSNVGPVARTDILPQYIETESLRSSNGFQSLWSDLAMPDCPNSTNMLADFDDDFLKPWRDYLPTPDGDSPTFNMSEEVITYPNPAASHLVEHQLIPSGPPPYQDDVPGCDCFQLVLQALHTMEKQSRSIRRPSLESVLSASKDVIARGEAMLRCTCSDDSTLVIILAGLIAKHLSFYRGGCNTLVSSPSSSSIGSESSMPLCSSRVTIGKYTMDGDDEERLRIEIMMMELQKLSTLLTKFRKKFSTLPGGYEGHMNETVLNFLNMRVREATDGLQREKQRLKGDS